MSKILFYGYGNPGRQDDGLGVLCAEKIKQWATENLPDNTIDVDTNYQLNIEDAEKMSHYDIVIFADASQEKIRQYELSRLKPSPTQVEFTMHAVSPAYVLHLCQNLFEKKPVTYLLHLRGYAWQFNQKPTHQALENLSAGFDAVRELILNDLLPQSKNHGSFNHLHGIKA
ncbi:hydrogenase maturation protease [Candidatus Sulfidibacterium hydrothermale]|uniref:hydrogenase maturation protease n=1 Tax=Candidatus Sulfidibacterium hydrothermale TaxID=2875962 RepID=UPI001F0B2802|nr:hydrogenase maturation protease [Candidatus Sulfidibacterium hydrothermale]UBM61144.1 hydrogenase maturation protease [Candidatus Sulfidibacterium hydrothermale]